MARLEAVQPVLMCTDVTASIRFFERLGFKKAFQFDPKYAGVTRDGVELHLQWHDELPKRDRPTYRFVVDDVDALYAEVSGVEGNDGPWKVPGNTPWGT